MDFDFVAEKKKKNDSHVMPCSTLCSDAASSELDIMTFIIAELFVSGYIYIYRRGKRPGTDQRAIRLKKLDVWRGRSSAITRGDLK